MTCTGCKGHWCWHCRFFDYDDEDKVYDHMKKDKDGKHMWPKQTRKNCPSCKKINCKTGKINYIKCHSCKIHFCFHCKDVRKGTE